jgi:hypothetical protein
MSSSPRPTQQSCEGDRLPLRGRRRSRRLAGLPPVDAPAAAPRTELFQEIQQVQRAQTCTRIFSAMLFTITTAPLLIRATVAAFSAF